MNVPTTVVAFGISIVEGISIGIISGPSFKVWPGSKFTMDCVYHNHYDGVCIGFNILTATNKMVGMFILLVFLSMYLFLTGSSWK